MQWGDGLAGEQLEGHFFTLFTVLRLLDSLCQESPSGSQTQFDESEENTRHDQGIMLGSGAAETTAPRMFVLNAPIDDIPELPNGRIS